MTEKFSAQTTAIRNRQSSTIVRFCTAISIGLEIFIRQSVPFFWYRSQRGTQQNVSAIKETRQAAGPPVPASRGRVPGRIGKNLSIKGSAIPISYRSSGTSDKRGENIKWIAAISLKHLLIDSVNTPSLKTYIKLLKQSDTNRV